MNATQQKNNSAAMMMLAMVIKNALEQSALQAEQDAQIEQQAAQYAEEHGMTLWQGQAW